ncbi:double-strand break repair helicase AddA [Pseudolabrys taiwanensis]|uniref:DNA 3'-5' helicase n=1 Tax=Pseudolabrys taiwanensis TaxID=331696 RepID=A0A345ZZL3_9HYPH|nr:double-strand break repair helicase AddA [Pseudolabrys taiwanensis]AXK82360.1 double-strand break repair helicase AddA [Pseudolabrys taiwanensis]
MTSSRTIPPDVRRVQIEAADPDISAFVSANAGSGKTHVLAQRVINLLLRGCDPAKILCITFTKAAAANMANRVFDTLAEWTTLDDAALDKRIEQSTGKKPGPSERARARRLFASALETPGGLKVQTIHAFCTRLLHQFPFEANVAARFTVLDEASTTQLLDQLTLDVLQEAAADPGSALGKALATAIVVAADQTFKDVITDAIRERDALAAWIGKAGSVAAAIDELSASFGLDPADTRESIEAEFFDASHVPPGDWPGLIDMLALGSANDKKHIAALQAARVAVGRDRIEQYLKVFCTSELEPRKNIITKALANDYPHWLERLQAEQGRVCALLARERALGARDRTSALVTIAAEVINRYSKEKNRRALLDYDDLIDKTLPLLSDGASAWVHYKLDLGIDHMLIDEAQDTSPQQWQIIQLLASEFSPGGARDNVKRTVFAVGDEKQSIFSFQGARPREFDAMRRLFERQFDNPAQGWRYLRFHRSFRSGQSVLGSVDQVFKAREVYASITTDEVGIPEHQALPDAAPGFVELWPLIQAADRREIEGWDAPFDTESEESPRVRLARKIATNVKRWTAQGLKAGDVLILVRQRGPLFEAIIRALKEARVPVAGADRLVLTEHIAVMDLLALADCLLLPDDDLALASVLKSPLFGLSEEQLFALAWNRDGALRAALRDNADFAETERALADMARAARHNTPFGFFAYVLGARGGRKQFLARLGLEANDALDEFLNLALDYEARDTPSLQGFVDWLRKAQSEVRRDMEMARDEVRVMTVHGAKGLEANTVILADTTSAPTGPRDPRLLHLPGGPVVWGTARSDDVGAMSEARERVRTDARDEYRRLLYVAMTRAAERLIVCGTQGRTKIPDGCWYSLVCDALELDCTTEPADDGDGEVLRYRKGEAQPAAAQPREEMQQPGLTLVPAWLSQAAKPEPVAVRTVTPSTVEEAVTRKPGATADTLALVRGRLTHRLMQALPDIPAARRAPAAADYLARAGTELPAGERDALAAQVMRVLEHPRLAALYGPESRAEVPIVGRLVLNGETIQVSGQIDRLAITEDTVFIGDFKTNRPPPTRIDEVPRPYITQLALYRAVLMKLYPDKAVRAALIWTEVPDLMELSTETLEAALAQVKPA